VLAERKIEKAFFFIEDRLPFDCPNFDRQATFIADKLCVALLGQSLRTFFLKVESKVEMIII